MNKDKCVLIIANKDTKIEDIQELYNQITPKNSIKKEEIIMSHLSSKIQANEAIKTINGKILNNENIIALHYNQITSIINSERREYTPLKHLKESELVEWQVDMKNEQFLVVNDDNINLYENSHHDDIKELQKERLYNMALLSNTGKYLAVSTKNLITLKGGNKFEIFDEIKIENLINFKFSEDDKFLIINQTNNRTRIYDINEAKEVIKTEAQEISISPNYMFLDKIYKIGADLNVLNKFEGIESNKIEKVEFKNSNTGILYNDKVKKVLFVPSKGKKISKIYVNIESLNFYWSKNKLFALVSKNVKPRCIVSLECFSATGEVSVNIFENPVHSLQVADENFVVFDSKYSLKFFSKSKSTFVETNCVNKTNKVLFSLNEKGDICVLYDYEDDNIEFYEKGQFITKYAHPSCSSILWSQSGLYVCTSSVGIQLSGLVQMFDCNGVLIWKRVFNRLSFFQWRPFIEISEDAKKRIKGEFEAANEDMIQNDEDLKEIFDHKKSEDLEEHINEWKEFLEKKKLLLSL